MRDEEKKNYYVTENEPCPCGSLLSYKDCCHPLIHRERPALSPEALMRSRYVAFKILKMDYLLDSTDPQTRKFFDLKANKEWAESAQFVRLEILKSSAEGNLGVVEFKAHFQYGKGAVEIHHEVSEFRKFNGAWYFRNGVVK